MSELDYFTLGQVLGAKMQPISPPVFGPFGILPLAVETAPARVHSEAPRPRFTVQQEKRIARCFERSRDGAPPDALLWDLDLRQRFLGECRNAGLDFTPPDLVRRLLAIRKSPKRYARLGITMAPTTRVVAYPSALAEYAPAIEFALVRLRYRFGASIDAILIDPVLGEELEKLVHAAFPRLPSQSMRQTALALRKARFLRKGQQAAIKRLRTNRLESAWSEPATLARITPDSVPELPGIVEIREPRRELYVARSQNLRSVFRTLTENNAISIMASPFWNPNCGDIQARFLTESALDSANLERWELKLLCEHKPVFNWPVMKGKRAA